jgi:hypothetical protein
MKLILITIAILSLLTQHSDSKIPEEGITHFTYEETSGTLICNDGTLSPTCDFCDQGCCSHHGGC